MSDGRLSRRTRLLLITAAAGAPVVLAVLVSTSFELVVPGIGLVGVAAALAGYADACTDQAPRRWHRRSRGVLPPPGLDPSTAALDQLISWHLDAHHVNPALRACLAELAAQRAARHNHAAAFGLSELNASGDPPRWTFRQIVGIVRRIEAL